MLTRTKATGIVNVIRQLVEEPGLKALPDQELLRRFVERRDEAAFAALVRRHGGMVLAVCRNMLPNEQDVEDVFQATFIVLARKARAIRKKASLGSWLHGVAYRTALKCRAEFARRRRHEGKPPARSAPAADDLTWREVQQC